MTQMREFVADSQGAHATETIPSTIDHQLCVQPRNTILDGDRFT